MFFLGKGRFIKHKRFFAKLLEGIFSTLGSQPVEVAELFMSCLHDS